MTTDRELLGRQNRARGKSIEEQLSLLHSVYYARNLAFVEHNGTVAEMRGGRWVPLDSLPDYSGLITRLDGKFVSFDVKLVSKPVYNHPKKKLHQTDYLWQVSQAGGIAFLLMVVEPLDRAWALWPQSHWQEYLGHGWSVHIEPNESPTHYSNWATEVPAWGEVHGSYIPNWLGLFLPDSMI